MADGMASAPVSLLIVFSSRNVQFDPVSTRNQTLINGASGFLARQLSHTISRLFGPKIRPSTGNAGDENDPTLKFSIPVMSPIWKHRIRNNKEKLQKTAIIILIITHMLEISFVDIRQHHIMFKRRQCIHKFERVIIAVRRWRTLKISF